MRGRRKLPVGELPKLFDLGVSRSQSGCRQRYVDVYTKFRSGRCARFGSAASLIYKTAALSPTELDDKVEIAVGNSEATLAAHQSSFGWRCTTRVLVIMNRPAGLSSRLQPRTRRGPGRACVRASAGWDRNPRTPTCLGVVATCGADTFEKPVGGTAAAACGDVNTAS